MKIRILQDKGIGLYKKEPHYNTDEFTSVAQHFKEFRKYTNYPVNTSPKSRWYKFWVEEARRCVFGYNIGRDWIPGYYYYYLNYHLIDKAVEETSVEGDLFELPDTALTFSPGEDTEFILNTPEDEDDEMNFSVKGKRIINFPDFWDGDYDYYHYLHEAEESGKHAVVFKTRGRGYSFKGASMLNRNFYLIPRSKSYAFAYQKEYLTVDGLLTKTWDAMSHIENNTPWGKRRSSVDTGMVKKASYFKMKDGIKMEMGFGSQIIGVTFKDDYNKGRGKRGKLILWEEAGSFKDLLKAWNISLKSMSQGRLTYGLSIAFGTGGSEVEDLVGLETLFLRGAGYRVHMIPNTIEPEIGAEKTGFFVSVLKNHEYAMDEHGNSLIERADKFIDAEREQVLEETRSKDALTMHCAEEPKVPSEGLMRVGQSWFPVKELQQQRMYLLSNKEKVLDSVNVGYMDVNEEGDPVLKYSDSISILDHWPHQDIKDLTGGIAIYEPPYKGSDGKVPDMMYLSGNDNYDHDKSTTDSVGSTYIMNKITGQLAAEYCGRPNLSSTFYEQNRLLLKLYNCRQNFENNLRGLEQFMRMKMEEWWLCETPEIIKDKISDSRVLERKLGTPGTVPIKRWGLEQLNIWLMMDVGGGLRMLNTIKSVALIDELIHFHEKANFDRVDSMIYLIIYYMDMHMRFGSSIESNTSRVNKLPDYFANNPIFKENSKNPENKRGMKGDSTIYFPGMK